MANITEKILYHFVDGYDPSGESTYDIWKSAGYTGGAAEFLDFMRSASVDGVLIKSIEQTKASDEDGGDNIITVTLTDGTVSTFTIKNGTGSGSTDASSQIAEHNESDTAHYDIRLALNALEDNQTIVDYDETREMLTIKQKSLLENGEVACIDKSLTVEGAVAEAKATGDAIAELNEKIVQYGTAVEEEVENQLDGTKADIVAELITQIGGLPVFGTVDDNNIITVTSTLADGEYVLKYEDANGTIVEIGTIVVGNGENVDDGEYGEPDEPITPVETNQIRLSVDANGNEYVGENGEDGYKVGYRVNSSGVEEKIDGMCVTGFIPYAYETIRLKNVTVTGTKTPYIAVYNADKSLWQVVSVSDRLIDDGNGVLTGNAPVNEGGWIRITCGVIDDTSILTLNTEIV